MYEKTRVNTASKYNPDEARIVRLTINKLKRLGVKDNDIGVISPYSAQVFEIRKLLTEHKEKSHRSYCEVSTVDGFQGREKDIVIISMVRCNDNYSVGFLGDERRLNMAITRARKLCIIIGNSNVVTKDSMKNQSKLWKVRGSTFYDNHNNFLTNMYNYFRLEGVWRDANDYLNDQFFKNAYLKSKKGKQSESQQNTFVPKNKMLDGIYHLRDLPKDNSTTFVMHTSKKYTTSIKFQSE